MSGDLKPGDVTTLGQLRPGDVARYLVNDDKPEFVFIVGTERGWGVHVARYPNRPLHDHYGEKDSAVRYLGRGRIEPARIVLDAEPDRVRELELQVARLRQAAVVERKELERRTKCPEQFKKLPFCSHHECHAIARIRAALAATAPKEKPCH